MIHRYLANMIMLQLNLVDVIYTDSNEVKLQLIFIVIRLCKRYNF